MINVYWFQTIGVYLFLRYDFIFNLDNISVFEISLCSWKIKTEVKRFCFILIHKLLLQFNN